MVGKPSDPKDIADMLEALANRIRGDPSLLKDGDRKALTVTPATPDDGAPALGALDVFADEEAVTVTVETRNAEASSVHVSLLDGRLLIGIGEGPTAFRRDLPLPAAVDEDGAIATFRNGILDVVLPRKRRGVI